MALGCRCLSDSLLRPVIGRVDSGARSEPQTCWWPIIWLWGTPRNLLLVLAERLVSVLGTARGKEVMPWALAKVSVYQGATEEPVELTASLQSLSSSTCWVVLMMGGGHFAGAVFRG